MERVVPVVDETIAALAKKRFTEDPIAGVKYSRATSIVSSAYKRHGRILETALREGLRESNRHRVWSESDFRVSRAVDALVGSMIGTANEDSCRQSALPYGERVRPLQVDMMAFDEADQTMRARRSRPCLELELGGRMGPNPAWLRVGTAASFRVIWGCGRIPETRQ